MRCIPPNGTIIYLKKGSIDHLKS
jgi:hypothetical protein